jgi:hypothetical protein
LDTDYTFDKVRGVYKRVVGTTKPADGGTVRINTWYLEPASVTQSLAAFTTGTDYRRIQLVALDKEINPDTGETVMEEGDVLTLYCVNSAGIDPAFALSDDNYAPGLDVTMSVLYSTSDGKVGDIKSISDKFTNRTNTFR